MPSKEQKTEEVKVREAILISVEEVEKLLPTPTPLQVCEIHVINYTTHCKEIQERNKIDNEKVGC